MKKLILLLALCGLIFSAATAQQSDETVFVRQVSDQNDSNTNLSENKFFSIFSNVPALSNLQQATMDASQIANINLQGDENIAVLSQAGFGNIGIIDVAGNGNNTSLDQVGTGLLSVLNIRGSFNNFDIQQQGTALQNFIQVTGNSIDIGARQNSAGIELVQQGAGVIPLSVQQTGSSVPIIITNN